MPLSRASTRGRHSHILGITSRLSNRKTNSERLLTTPEHDQPNHESLFPASKRRTSKKLRWQSGYCEYKMKALLIKVGFYDAFLWSLNKNKFRKVAAMEESGVVPG